MAEENFKIISSIKNPFLDREELIIELTGDVPPSNSEVKEMIGKDPNAIVINTIKTSFGTQTYLADVFVYDSVESKEKIQTIPQKVRKKLSEELASIKKAEAESTEEPTVESSKEKTKTKETVESTEKIKTDEEKE